MPFKVRVQSGITPANPAAQPLTKHQKNVPALLFILTIRGLNPNNPWFIFVSNKLVYPKSFPMPFTFAHPAVFVPLRRLLKQKVSVTGLVAGSLVPDVEYFIRMRGVSRYSHSWAGLFWFDLPLGVLLAFLFHSFFRNLLILQLPVFVQKRLQPLLRFNWGERMRQHAFAILLSFVAGSLSHLLWDRFVHEGAQLLNQLFERYQPLSKDDDFFIYYLFFGLNSLAGMVVLWRYFRRLPAFPVTAQRPTGFPFWSVCFLIAAVVLLIRLLTGRYLSLLGYVDSAIAAFLIALVLTVVIQKLGGPAFKKTEAKEKALKNIRRAANLHKGETGSVDFTLK